MAVKMGILHKGTKVVYNFEHTNWPQKGTKSAKGFNLNLYVCFLVPMLQRGNAYHMGSHAGAWEPGKNDHLKCKPENEGCLKMPYFFVRIKLALALGLNCVYH